MPPERVCVAAFQSRKQRGATLQHRSDLSHHESLGVATWNTRGVKRRRRVHRRRGSIVSRGNGGGELRLRHRGGDRQLLLRLLHNLDGVMSENSINLRVQVEHELLHFRDFVLSMCDVAAHRLHTLERASHTCADARRERTRENRVGAKTGVKTGVRETSRGIRDYPREPAAQEGGSG